MSETGLRGNSFRQPGSGPLGRDDPPPTNWHDEITREARERFRQIADWENGFRQQFTADLRFANGDADNHWQWPDTMFGDREEAARPSLTVNKTRQHCLQIINDAKQNKPEIRVNPVSDEATKEAADVFEGIIRHIEYVSNASTAYDTATEHQVQGGIGWWRVVTDYESDNSFDQAIFIRRIKDALTVYLDPDIKEIDGSDARYGFVIDDCPRDEFELKYPEFEMKLPTQGFGMIDGGWLDEDHVRVAEYYRKSQRQDTLHQIADGTTYRESELETREMVRLLREASVKSRELKDDYVEWFLIVGGTIVDYQQWAGKHIPLVRVVGEECIIEGQLERKGHTRALKDPQRIYNYWSSSGVESVALQSKTPYIAPSESIENFQRIWDTANTENHPVLPYTQFGDAGQQYNAPVRQEPPQMAQAYISGLQIAQNEMMLVSGQYQPTMGQVSPSPETSGRAIALRQRQADNSTYHYVDNLATAIRFTGRILLDLIPKIYDTPRLMRILQLDGSVDRIRLDPQAPQALTSMQSPNADQANLAPIQPPPQQAQRQAVLRIFNPNVGRYEVRADVGPSFMTKRQEAYNAFVQIIQSAPQMLNIVGDLMFKSADFPMSDEVAERLQRTIPPNVLGLAPSPQDQQLMQQMQQAQAHAAILGERLAIAEMKLKSRDEQKDIDAYEAVTSRLGTLLNAEKTDSAYASGNEIRMLIRQMVEDAMANSMTDVSAAARAGMAQNTMPLTAGQGASPAQMQALAPGRPPSMPAIQQ